MGPDCDPRWRAGELVALTLVLALASCTVMRAASPPTGIEAGGWQRPSTPDEIVRFLGDLARRHDRAEVVEIGRSAGGRPLETLLLRSDPSAARRLTVMIVGSQHGTEPSGGEAVQMLAREIAAGAYPDMDFIFVPDSNPDGRAAHRRVNANGVNLSTDYVLLSQPETRAVNAALLRWRPDVVLDVHESAILKKKTLGAAGYMTDFETQVELANHPDVDAAIAELSRSRLLPETIASIERHGVRAQHYIGEITDLAQPITHGGLTIRNLRNKAALYGSVSFLIESRLDPPGTRAATPRNIRGRVEKQRTAIHAFLDVCRAHRAEIATVVDRARDDWLATDEPPVHLVARWGPNRDRPQIEVPLRRIADGVLEQRTFALHDAVEALAPVAPPLAYVVTENQDHVAELLDRNGIVHERGRNRVAVNAVALNVAAKTEVAARHGWGYTDYEIEERRAADIVDPGALWIPLRQPSRRLIPLLLEPRSNAGFFQDTTLAESLVVGRRAPVTRIEQVER